MYGYKMYLTTQGNEGKLLKFERKVLGGKCMVQHKTQILENTNEEDTWRLQGYSKDKVLNSSEDRKDNNGLCI